MSGSLKLNTPSAGSVTLSPADTASNVTVTIPAATATLVDASSSQTLTNKTLTAAGSNTVEATSGPTSTQLAGQRNKIINGAMMIGQRNAGASVTPTASGYTLDRWYAQLSQSSKYSVQQNAGAITPPVGFINYLGITSTSAYSITSSDQFNINQRIEGLNISDLAWGTSSAKTVTLSFWVYSSLTGTFGGAVTNSGVDRSYPFSYTISAANTWEQKSITIAGDTSGTWLTTNGIGIRLYINLGAGSTLSGTAGSWAAATYTSATGATSVVGTNGATFYITGVQLEKGATATPFENRLYGTELALCQRYYEMSYDVGSVPGTAAVYAGGFEAIANSTDVNWLQGCRFRVNKRAIPTITIYSCDSGTTNTVNRYAGGAAITVSNVDNTGMTGFMRLVLASTPATAPYRYQWTASSEL